jgi:hypothetical protein
MTITANKEGICLEFHGAEQLWALRAKITVPKEAVTTISYQQDFRDWRKWEVRMPGTGAPKLLLAGSYWTEEGWDFLYIKRPGGYYKPRVENVLVIETNQNRYRRIIVSYDEKEADKIVKWWRKK